MQGEDHGSTTADGGSPTVRTEPGGRGSCSRTTAARHRRPAGSRRGGTRRGERLLVLSGAGLMAAGLALGMVGSQAGASSVAPEILTQPSASTVALGGSVTDTATAAVIAGVDSGIPSDGTVQFDTCGPFPTKPPLGECTIGATTATSSPGVAPLGTPLSFSANGADTSFVATSTPYTPTQTGVYCFGFIWSPPIPVAVHAHTPTNTTTTSVTDECFTVQIAVPTPNPVSSDSITASPSASTITLGSTDTDVAVVTGTGGGTPTGSVTFTVCGPFGQATACTSGSTGASDVGSAVLGSGSSASGSGSSLAGSGSSQAQVAHAASTTPTSATATSAPFAPAATGTYCFLAAYGGNGTYQAASDSTPATQCFDVVAAATKPAGSPSTVDPGFTTALLTSPTLTVGATARDSAILTGSAGAPTGSVTFRDCREAVAGTPCSGGSTLAAVSTPTSSSAGRAVYDLPAADALAPTAPGSWCFSASYSGDATYSAMAVETNPAAECFTVAAAPVAPATAATGSTVPPVIAAANGAAIVGATVVHTGQWWAGSLPYVLVATGFGMVLLAMGERRHRARRLAVVRAGAKG